MRIKVTWYEHDYYGTIEEMEIDGKAAGRAGGGEPEDMIIGRDVMSMVEVSDLMKCAYDAGKSGEAWEYEYVKRAD